MYERHIFQDGPKLFDKRRNQYIEASDPEYQGWVTESQPVYTYSEEEQEETYEVVEAPESEVKLDAKGKPIASKPAVIATRTILVTVATPVMETDEEGNETQKMELVHTLKEYNVGDL